MTAIGLVSVGNRRMRFLFGSSRKLVGANCILTGIKIGIPEKLWPLSGESPL